MAWQAAKGRQQSLLRQSNSSPLLHASMQCELIQTGSENSDNTVLQTQEKLGAKRCEHLFVSDTLPFKTKWLSHKVDKGKKGKAVPQHTYGDAGGRGCIAPTHSRPRHSMGVSGQRHAPAAL
jgi:hypothetical protein